jgi:hypothetical protein
LARISELSNSIVGGGRAGPPETGLSQILANIWVDRPSDVRPAAFVAPFAAVRDKNLSQCSNDFAAM